MTINNVALGNAFFWTKDGRIGAGPHAIAVGDVVARIPGIQVPMILRPTQLNTYQVIGPSHVSGVGWWGMGWSAEVAAMMQKKIEDRDLQEEVPVDDDNLCDIFLV